MHSRYNRRHFLWQASAGAGWGLLSASACKASKLLSPNLAMATADAGKRIGIIGLDTSHSTAFVETLNKTSADKEYNGYRVVAAYPYGSRNITSSAERIPGYTEEVKKHGVRIVDSIESLLGNSDVIMLETNDGTLHLQQAMQVIKSGKRIFIDKPVAASLVDVLAIYRTAEKSGVPVFSSSSLRFAMATRDAALGKTIGKIEGADTYSPCEIEKTHPDLFWYGIHGVEALFTVMGKGCIEVRRVSTENADIVMGIWDNNRIGTFRGMRNGKTGYGGTAFGEKGTSAIGMYEGYEVLLKKIIDFFDTGISPVNPEDTIAIYTFMQAADESKKNGGAVINMVETLRKAQEMLPP